MQSAGRRVQGSGCRVQGVGSTLQGVGSNVECGEYCRVWGVPWTSMTELERGPPSSSSLSINVERFRGGLVLKAHRFLYHSTLGLSVIKKKKEFRVWGPVPYEGGGWGFGCRDLCHLRTTA